ncbi:MAG: DUF5680 domain-containing protein [archaeon]
MGVNISVKELKNFLDKANKNTYANKNAKKSEPTRLKSEDYQFEEDNLIYHDTYFGARDFIGEEIVYKDKIPVWGANYFGFIIDSSVSEKEVYDFLRKALIQNHESEISVRGPEEFSEGDWIYRFSVKGSLANFSGSEEILVNRKVVYRCFVHGGFVN